MVDNILELFQSFRTILCVCPHCGDILRLSDLHLKYKGEAPRTWLDTYESKLRRLEEQQEGFKKEEKKLHKAAIERGHDKVPAMISQCIDEDMARLNYNPYDIKPLFHPVDFVVFNGLSFKGEVEDVTFLSKKTSNDVLNKIRSSLNRSLDKNRYEWQVARVTIDGKVSLE
jgi:predicted Holliday junction resolvase-like endonuclease